MSLRSGSCENLKSFESRMNFFPSSKERSQHFSTVEGLSSPGLQRAIFPDGHHLLA